MRRLLVATALIALLPLAASAQIEVGFDAGFTLISPDIEGVDTDNITTFEIPFFEGDTVFPDFNMFIVSVGLSYFFR